MSAISGYISQIQNAVYGEQVRGAIVSALEQCYSDVSSPSLQTEAFQTALNAAYAGGILDIQTVTQISAMTNQNIIYRYNGTEAGKQKGLYYYSALSSAWVLIGSEIQSVANAAQMTDTSALYKFTGTAAGMVTGAIYAYNGSAWLPIGSGLMEAATAAQMTNTAAIYKYTGTESGYTTNALYYYNGLNWTPVSPTPDVNLAESGKPADAKATGAAIDTLQDEIDEINDTLESTGGLSLPKLNIFGDFSQMTAEKNEVNYYYHWMDGEDLRAGYVAAKWQGDSSTMLPKKNYTLKFYFDSAYHRKDKTGFFDLGKESKWVTKANYIDPTQARNVVSARLWGDVVKSRKTAPPTELINAPNYGATNGYPIEIYNNGEYLGIYTLIIPKDDWMLGMDEDNPLHCMLQGATNSTSADQNYATDFRTASLSGWDTEIGTLSTEMGNKFKALISFVMDSTDTVFHDELNNVLDVESAIDYYIFMLFIGAIDSAAKNLAMATYNGGDKWYCTYWDMDSTYGMDWNGGRLLSPLIQFPGDFGGNSLLWERLSSVFAAEIEARYIELRETVLSVDFCKKNFGVFFDMIGKENYKKDAVRWPAIPTINTDQTQFIPAWIAARANYLDPIIAPGMVVECTGLTLDKSTITFNDAHFEEITATKTPANSTQKITWSSSNNSVVRVAGGRLMPIAAGSAIITATCGEHSATCSITVNDISEEIEWSAAAQFAFDENGDVVPGTNYVQTNEFAGDIGNSLFASIDTNYTFPTFAVYDNKGRFSNLYGGNTNKVFLNLPGHSSKLSIHPKDATTTTPSAALRRVDVDWLASSIAITPNGLNGFVGNYAAGNQIISARPVLVEPEAVYMLSTDISSNSFLTVALFTKEGEFIGMQGGAVYSNNIPVLIPDDCYYVMLGVRANGSLDTFTQQNEIAQRLTFVKM